jgi:MFS family permease
VCFGAFWGTWAVSASDIKASLGVSNGVFGVVLSAALLAAVAANTVAGPVAERWGTQTGLTGVLVAWGLLIVIGSVVHVAVLFGSILIAVIAVGGAVDVVMNVAATAALAAHPGRLVRFHGLFNAGAVAGALATGLVSRFAGLSWRGIWLVVGLAAFALARWCRSMQLPAGTVGERHGPLAALRTIHREHLIVLAAVFATAAMVEGGIDTWGVLFLREHLASGLIAGAVAYVLGQSVATLARFTLGPAAGSLGAARGVAVGAGLAAGGLVLMASVSSPGLAGAGLIAAAGGISVCWPLLLAHASAQYDRPALVVGGVTSVGYLGFVLGPTIVGLLAQTFGLRAGLVMLALAASAVAATASRRAPPAAGLR